MGMKHSTEVQTELAAKPNASHVVSTAINRDYAVRFLGVAALFIALSGWFLYDGKIGYPEENAQVAPITAALAKQELTATDWMNTAKTGVAPLTEAFRKAGMQVPSKYSDAFNSWIRAGDERALEVKLAQNTLLQPVHSAEDIQAQFVSAGIGLLAALGLLVLLAVRLFTRMTLDAEALTVTFGKQSQRYLLAELKALDTRQWEKRGILRATFVNGTVVLDAWHHAGVREIAARLMERMPA